MVKTGVVDGVVKTASADNEEDHIGAAAKCIRDAEEGLLELHKVLDETGVAKEAAPAQ